MHLAHDGLHLNRKGAYVLKTVMESFVVDLDMMQINSAVKFVSSDLCHTVDTRMSYADVVKQFPPREKLQAMDHMHKVININYSFDLKAKLAFNMITIKYTYQCMFC
jgi:hypothetical protein